MKGSLEANPFPAGAEVTRLNSHRAFSLIELTVVIAVIALLAAIFLPALAMAKQKVKRMGCVNLLKSMGVGFRIFANDKGDRFSWQASTNQPERLDLRNEEEVAWVFLALSNELATPKSLICPADTRMPAHAWAGLTRSNISYFVGLDAGDTSPQMLLAGDRNLTTNGVPAGPGLVRITTPVAWGFTKAMHRRSGNVVLGDGSVQQMTRARLGGQVAAPGAITNWLLIP
jgi:prepilin-type N-terminal cleavage/methylation domain-containing protein